MLFSATSLGIPVSTTHKITGCILGVTIPAAGLIAALTYGLTRLF